MSDYLEFLRRKAIIDPPTGLAEVPILHPSLYDFQSDITRWALRRGRAAIFADCGLYKTGMQAEWSRYIPGDVLILAPLAVAPQTVAIARDNLGIEIRYCRDQSEVKPGITITNYEMLEHFDPDAFKGIVLDECFAAGTEIDTLEGRQRIETIHEGVYILNASGVDRVSDVHRREVPYAVRVTTATASFIASPNHPIFTQRGWVGAQHLRAGDYALQTGAAMRMVRGDILPEVSGAESAEVLREILFSEMEDDATGSAGEGSFHGGPCGNREEEVSMAAIGQSEGAERNAPHSGIEPCAKAGGSSKNQPHIESHEAQSFRAWGQWQGAHATAIDSDGCIGRRLDSGICFVTGPTQSRLSDLLQARLRESATENRNRGGWRIASQPARNGREEGRNADWVRVDGAEILEPGNPDLEQYRDADGKLYFYDLGATRHPSYSVGGLLVHNSSILKAYDGKTRTAIIDAFQQTPFRLACTATPAPNDYMELGNHAEFLGVMSRVEMLSMFFVHDGGETQKWRLKGHAESEFWKWLASWAVCIRKPSDLGYDDGAFILPELVMHQITVKVDEPTSGFLFPIEARELKDRLAARRDTIEDRVKDCAAIVNQTDEQFIVWCNLNAESAAIAKMIPGSVEVVGSDSREFKEKAVADFISGRARVIVSKASMFGYGLNLQCSRNMAFLGLSDSYEQFYQACRRQWRFGQNRPVNCYVITAETEGAVVANIKRKEADAMKMAESMVEHMKDLNRASIQGVQREKAAYARDAQTGDGWTLHLADCVDVARELLSDSLHYSIYSPPFASLYTYSNSDRDMGNCTDDATFMEQYRFLVLEKFRATMPGRLTSVHCMDMPSMKERDGVIGLKDLPGAIVRQHQAVGWIFHSRVTIWKDPVTQMQRTKALGLLHKQIKKDSCMSRQGTADYVLTFRKPGENPERVTHTNEDYPVQLWQNVASPVWMDIDPSDTLSYREAREHNDERHICALQLQVIERCIKLWSNPGDTVFSPFAGIGSEGYQALKMWRKFLGAELKRSYWEQACRNLDQAKREQGGLFAEVACPNRASAAL